MSTAHQPSHDTLSWDPLYHRHDQDSIQALPWRPKERTPWGVGSGGEGERHPGDRTGEAGGRASHAELPRLSLMLARPALLNCWGQNRSDGWGGVTVDASSFSQTPRQSTLQTCQASFSPRASCRAPEPQPHVGGYPGHTLQSSTFPALRRVL